MLVECLRSLSQLVPIDGVPADIIVIDNEPEASQKAKEAAGRFGAHYRHQPEMIEISTLGSPTGCCAKRQKWRQSVIASRAGSC